MEEAKLDVLEVESAEAAVDFLQGRGGDVAMIFADIRLQGTMNGVQLAKATCTLRPTIRIVLTSGAASASPENLPECVNFMPKPWRGLYVLVEAEKAINQPQLPVT